MRESWKQAPVYEVIYIQKNSLLTEVKFAGNLALRQILRHCKCYSALNLLQSNGSTLTKGFNAPETEIQNGLSLDQVQEDWFNAPQVVAIEAAVQLPLHVNSYNISF